MKLSYRQLLASAGGAVIAAAIASLFGVKGTIVGVAIGSAAATFGTAFLAQQIDRGHAAVKQVVVRVPETSTLHRLLGGTATAGVAEFTAEKTTPPPVESGTATESGPATVASSVAVPLDLSTQAAAAAADAEADADAEAGGGPSHDAESEKPHSGVRWPAIAGAVAGVFVLSLLFVTAVELIAGRPLADLFGGHVKGGGTTVQQIIESPPATLPKPTPTTSTTSSTSSTSTSSTVPGGTTTLTGAGSSTSTSVGETTTSGGSSTSSPGSATSTTAG